LVRVVVEGSLPISYHYGIDAGWIARPSKDEIRQGLLILRRVEVEDSVVRDDADR
jgi:hypothetical protein